MARRRRTTSLDDLVRDRSAIGATRSPPAAAASRREVKPRRYPTHGRLAWSYAEAGLIGMTVSPRRGYHLRALRRTRAFLSGPTPLLLSFGCLLLLSWSMGVWLLQFTYRDREDTAFQMLKGELRYAEQKIVTMFDDADRTLLDT